MSKQIIGPENDPYMTRWILIPKNRWCNVYLHKFHRSDDDRALHDHPWWSVGLILRGGYYDVTPNGSEWLGPGRIKVRPAETKHRVWLRPGTSSWSLFIVGRRVREWGFWCPQGWRHWKEFTKPSAKGGASGEIGRGCE